MKNPNRSTVLAILPAPMSLVLLLAVAAPHVHAEGDKAPDEGYKGGIAVGFVQEDDPDGGPDLDGVHLGFAAFSVGRSPKSSFYGSWYVEWKESRRQEILEAGATIAYPYFRFSRVGFGPRFALALQERAEPPHRGTDGMASIGFDFGIWLSRRVHLAAVAQRGTGFESGARNAYSVQLRILPWSD